MPGAFRSILALILGSALLGTSHSHPVSNRIGKQQEAKAEPAYTPSPVALNIGTQESVEKTVLTQPCKPSQDNRNSDLCAQWKAADAASRAAIWGMFGTLVAALGTMGLYWQIVLTRKAVKDTTEATAAIQEANKIAQAEQRAWLIIEPELLTAECNGIAFEINWKAHLKNIGKTVAEDIAYVADILFGSDDIIGEISKMMDRLEQEAKIPGDIDALIPNESVWVGGRVGTKIRTMPWSVGGRTYMLIVALARYRVVGDAESHTTARSFAIGFKDDEQFRYHSIRREDLTIHLSVDDLLASLFGPSVTT